MSLVKCILGEEKKNQQLFSVRQWTNYCLQTGQMAIEQRLSDQVLDQGNSESSFCTCLFPHNLLSFSQVFADLTSLLLPVLNGPGSCLSSDGGSWGLCAHAAWWGRQRPGPRVTARAALFAVCTQGCRGELAAEGTSFPFSLVSLFTC